MRLAQAAASPFFATRGIAAEIVASVQKVGRRTDMRDCLSWKGMLDRCDSIDLVVQLLLRCM